jgi:TonB family protein
LPDHFFGSPPVGSIERALAFGTLILALMVGSVPISAAQKAPKPERKVLVLKKPQYPEPLKQAQIGGLVRLRATVLPNGTVSNVDVLGGNPILAESAVAAVKKWKFAPAASQTIEDISLNFNPRAE